MIRRDETLRMGYVTKMFPRLSETFILNEILELERRGVEVVIFSAKKPNEGRFHPQLSRLKAPVLYLEDLDGKKWADWIGAEWPRLSAHADRLWTLEGEEVPAGNSRRLEQVWHGAWIASRAEELGLSRLHAHFASLPSDLAYFAHRVSGIPFSFTAHAKDIYVYDPAESGLREKIEASQFMVTVTEYNRRYLLDSLPGITADRIKVVYNGIDLSRFAFTEASGREADLILGVGRLVPKKGFGDLLEACALLKQRGVPYRCEIMGDGVDADLLHARRDELGLQDEVTFTGAVHQDQVRARMARAGVFCLPCCVAGDNNVDALPTVLLESLATGLPVVSTAISGVPEIVTSGGEGDLVDANDPEALSRALEQLLADADRREAYGHHGRAKAETAFDQRRNVGRLLELYRTGGGDQATSAADGAAEQDAAELAGTTPRAGLRILYACTDRGIPFGGGKGAAIHVREFLDGFTDEGGEAVVAVRRAESLDSRPPRYPVHVVDPGLPSTVPSTAALAEADEFARNAALVEALNAIPVTAGVDCVYERYSLFGIAGREYARRRDVPFVLEVNAPLVKEAAAYRALHLVDVAREVEQYLFSTADHIVTVSDAVREYVLGVAPQAAVTVVPNGVDTDRFRPSSRTPHARARVGAAGPDDVVVGFVGRVRPWHGVDVLVEAVARARATAPGLRLCVVGDVRGAEEGLRRRAEQLGLADAVTFTGPVSNEDIPELLAAMDVLAAPYPQLDHFYFSPLKIFEYMAAGRPIVASSVGQVSDVLEHEATALLTAPGDAGALGESLARLATDADLAARLGDAARKVAVAEHTWRHRVRTIMDIMASLAARQGVQAS